MATTLSKQIPIVAPFPLYDKQADKSFNGNAAVGASAPIALQTVPVGEVWVLRYTFVKLRKITAVNDISVSLVLVRNGVTTTIRYEGSVDELLMMQTDLQIVLKGGDTITVTAQNNSAAAIAVSFAYVIDVHTL